MALELLLLLFLLLLLVVRRKRGPDGFPPGPPNLPLLGSLPFVMGDGKRPSFFHGSRKLVEKYGKVDQRIIQLVDVRQLTSPYLICYQVVGFHLGRMPVVLVSDFAALRAVLRHPATAARPPIDPLNEAKVGHDAPNLEGSAPGILLTHVRRMAS